MKQITCAAMGGPAECTTTATGNTAMEMVDNGFAHVMEAHPEMAEKIKNNTPEENEAWMAEFSKQFDELPEMAE